MQACALLVLVATSYGSLAQSIQSLLACSSLVTSLGPSIVQSTSGPQFDAGAHHAWNTFNAVLTPTCVVFPRQAAHVQQAMRIIFEFRSRYAVQAGGHSGMLGWDNVQDGVLIHFMNMTRISYDPDSDTITLEPGVRWGDAIETLQTHGVAPVGGRHRDVGTGSLLGGGTSFLSPAHGYAADNFKSLDVVLVTGELVTANASNEHADLFRVLKGSANRFGVVTKYELTPVHTGAKDDKVFFGGFITYPSWSVEAVIKAAAHYVHDVTDPKASLYVTVESSHIPRGHTTVGIVYLFYNGTELPTDIFGEFLSIPAIFREIGPLSYYDMAHIVPDPGRGFGHENGASAAVGDEELFSNAHKQWENFTRTFMSEMSRSSFAITPVPVTQIQVGRERGGNAIDPPTINFAILQFGQQYKPGVTTPLPDVDAGRLLLFKQVPRSHGLPLFMNECDKSQNVFQSYGAFEEIKRVYAKYDPTGFNIAHTEGPIGLETEEKSFKCARESVQAQQFIHMSGTSLDPC